MKNHRYFIIYNRLDKDIAGISAGIPIGLVVNFFSSSFNPYFIFGGVSTLLTFLIMLRLIKLKNDIKNVYDKKLKISETLFSEKRIPQPDSPETSFVNTLNFDPKQQFKKKLIWYPLTGLLMIFISAGLLVMGHLQDVRMANNDENSLTHQNQIEHSKVDTLIKDSTMLADSIHWLNHKMASSSVTIPKIAGKDKQHR